MTLYALILVTVWGKTMITEVLHEGLTYGECEMLDAVLTPVIALNGELMCEVTI